MPVNASISDDGPTGAPARPTMTPAGTSITTPSRSMRSAPRWVTGIACRLSSPPCSVARFERPNSADSATLAAASSTTTLCPMHSTISRSVIASSAARSTAVLPSRMIVQTSAIWRISRIRCETNSTASPVSAINRRITAKSRVVSAAVRLAVGSSSKSSFAPDPSARAISTSCRSCNVKTLTSRPADSRAK